MNKQITISLPLPPKELNPNGRPHWRAKAKAVQQYRKTSAEMARVAAFRLVEFWTPLTEAVVQITYYHRTAAFKDRDNIIAELKSAIDGLTDGGILTDDKELHYRSPIRKKDASCPGVELTITGMTTSSASYDPGGLICGEDGT